MLTLDLVGKINTYDALWVDRLVRTLNQQKALDPHLVRATFTRSGESSINVIMPRSIEDVELMQEIDLQTNLYKEEPEPDLLKDKVSELISRCIKTMHLV